MSETKIDPKGLEAATESAGLRLLLHCYDEHRARLDKHGGSPRVTEAVRATIVRAIEEVKREAAAVGAQLRR